ncbi:NAD(P)-dependent dehydrogenase, short-chain alcohol dehydrogenase family [Paenibacillus catalpae]|uniref:NAD(P)-dependent dehydrogenase, short-chain alcohol dehydrogenase family n=1 Tax=Paenibacillus catalpae TaxID=1045775 RepID=A0A1I1XU62_9BACL|nr:SDR family oxidoreductase [Paenibacillus catalpae]SFE10824.1 NAD(P)-dependent dehydrogenase, short-chain alcohol dehydrogenase family [Paenibacillus catalpae]
MNILITGASRGLGLEMAAEALERGHQVIAGVRDPEGPSKLTSLVEQYGSLLELAKLDVTNEAGLAELADLLKQHDRPLGAIINNAAILVERNTPIEKLNIEEVARTFDINLFGPMRVVKHFLPLITEPNGAIINISSEAGSISNAYPGDYPYGISKTAMNMFTQQLLSAVKERGIQVLSVHPGWMKTDMGGENAPTNPRQSAKGILDLIEGRIVPETRFNFVDYTGKEMPI